MKRIISFNLYIISLVLLMFFAGCSDTVENIPTPNEPEEEEDPNNTEEEEENETVSINKWMFDYLKTHYLWNDAVKNITPDYNVENGEFLLNVLNEVAAQDDVNHDDGYWQDGERIEYYSYLARYPISTRGLYQTTIGTGIEVLHIVQFGGQQPGEDLNYTFVVSAITPGSPAETAGLKRGDLILKVDGMEMVNTRTLEEGWTKLMEASEAGEVTVTIGDLNTGEEKDLIIPIYEYKDDPIWATKIIETDGGKKIGYFSYGSFNSYYDESMINVFQEFRDKGVDDVILDLRYNTGGYVLASTVLGTLIAGENYKGELYATSKYNNDRKDDPAETYRIGEPNFYPADEQYNYPLIQTALSSSLSLPRVYILCSAYTASASELVINGLRGLGIEVYLIGETTNGKNVGMEAIYKTFGDYEYMFAPITFYLVNKEGFNDYGNGFTPDVEVSDEYYWWYEEVANENGENELIIHPIEWGDNEHDLLVQTAVEWIETGTKPTLSRTVNNNIYYYPNLQKIIRPETMSLSTKRLNNMLSVKALN